MNACTHETHAALRADVLLFLAGTTNLRRWDRILIAECLQCPEGMRSTLALHLCKLCDSACPSTDCLPIPGSDEEFAHVACVITKSLAANRVKFVLAAGRLG